MNAAEAQPKQKIIEHPELDPSTGFDYRTHIKDARTGKLIRLQNYARHAREGQVLLERPVGSGNCFHENGEVAGHWDIREWQKLSATHTEVRAVPANREEELEHRNEMLERELAAVKAAHEVHTTQKAPVQAHTKK